MSADELPLEALKELPKDPLCEWMRAVSAIVVSMDAGRFLHPEDAPNGHDAWKVVKWEPSNNRVRGVTCRAFAYLALAHSTAPGRDGSVSGALSVQGCSHSDHSIRCLVSIIQWY